MIEPNRSIADLDLLDEKTPLKLLYDVRSFRDLCGRFGDLQLFEINRVFAYLTVVNLAAFIRAGRLWEDPETRLEAIEARLDATRMRITDITDVVSKAVLAGMRDPDVEESDAEANPPTPAVNGAGETSSDLPSGSSG